VSGPSCTRTWEAEAVEDGRLDGADRASFERHAAVCRACTREVNMLAELRHLGRAMPEPVSSPLERKRRRASLLRRANDHIVHRPLSAWLAPRRWSVALAFVACCGITLAFASRWRHRGAALEMPQGPLFEITSMESAHWNVVRSGPITHVALIAGAVAVHVEKLADGEQFVLLLPDGELEVRGTRFSVDASEAHTQRVAVTEGVIGLRIAGQPERTLAAGESWVPEEARVVAGAASGAFSSDPRAEPGASAPSASAAPPPSTARREPRKAGHGRGPWREANSSPPEKGATPNAETNEAPRPADVESTKQAETSRAGVLFAQAMQAFDARSYELADSRFVRFQQEFRDDARREDASFLRIVCALRRGDQQTVVQLSHAYLGEFPSGLRRRDVERLLR
jgi:hypothetical protein